jgi:HD-GYP domain-containing protein (c-di-GMP phosphodiesterase class II)
LGCILHDVGKMKIPPEILQKPGRLTDEEMDIIRQHPVLGYEMVKGRVPTNAAQVVLNHHQRYNGEGYPARIDFNTKDKLPPLRGKQIPILCRIATVCDVYDAATTKRCYSDAKPPVQVLHEMRTWCEGFFDPVVFKAFLETIPAFPIGQIVHLGDGTEAAVVDFNSRHPKRPKIQCLRRPNGELIADPSLEEIDLAIYTDMMITHVDGVDVRPYQLSPKEQRQATLV